jgi:hypothetical protein
MKPGRREDVLLLLLASAPLSWLMLFGSYVLRARLALGWPLPYQPDPYELGFHLHYLAIALCFPLCMLMALAGVVAAWLPRAGGVRALRGAGRMPRRHREHLHYGLDHPRQPLVPLRLVHGLSGATLWGDRSRTHVEALQTQRTRASSR